MSFDKLKKNSQSAISKLVEAAEKLSSPKGNYVDESYWNPTLDKAGNGFAIIRFLPAKEGEDLPWIQYWDHGFKGPSGLWYIENSLTSLGQADPVSESNSVLWNSGIESDKEIARERKRRLHYVSNIEVISDSANPENEGKIFRYKYGKKIFNKIMDVMQPQFQDEKPINPFDFWTGANFKLKIRNVEGYRNYDKSEFEDISAHRNGDDAQLAEIYENLFSLQELIDPKNYKSYGELKTKFLNVIGENEANSRMSISDQVDLDNVQESKSIGKSLAEPELEGDDDKDTLSYFAKLARGE